MSSILGGSGRFDKAAEPADEHARWSIVPSPAFTHPKRDSA